MRNFQDTFKTRKRSLIDAFSTCMTVPLKYGNLKMLFNSILSIFNDLAVFLR